RLSAPLAQFATTVLLFLHRSGAECHERQIRSGASDCGLCGCPPAEARSRAYCFPGPATADPKRIVELRADRLALVPAAFPRALWQSRDRGRFLWTDPRTATQGLQGSAEAYRAAHVRCGFVPRRRWRAVVAVARRGSARQRQCTAQRLLRTTHRTRWSEQKLA